MWSFSGIAASQQTELPRIPTPLCDIIQRAGLREMGGTDGVCVGLGISRMARNHPALLTPRAQRSVTILGSVISDRRRRQVIAFRHD